MKKIYLVDSENVGDIWVPLLVSSQPEDVILVFYTQKSPHMNYENVRMLKEAKKEATFVKCFEGSNALDFQLVTELGYRLRADAECEYVIVSNDTGYDAVVRYWAARQMPVSRLSGKECARKLSGRTERPSTGKKVSEERNLEVESGAPAEQNVTAEKNGPAQDVVTKQKNETEQESIVEPENETKQDTVPEVSLPQDEAVPSEQEMPALKEDGTEEILKNLCCCISKDSLADFHNALVTFFGEEQGKELYQKMKSKPEWNAYWTQIPACSQEEKFNIYCKLVFEVSELADDYPEDFASFLFKANGKRKNLNSLRAALQGHYGKEKGMKYYSLIKELNNND